MVVAVNIHVCFVVLPLRSRLPHCEATSGDRHAFNQIRFPVDLVIDVLHNSVG